MSQENVEIVKRANAAFYARDLETWMSSVDSEFEFVDHIAAVCEESGAGIEITLRDGKIVRAELGFPDKAAALQTAGLPE